MEITSLYEEFVSYLDLERGYSPLTISAYRSDFRLFTRFLDDADLEASADAVDRQSIRQYIAWMRGEGLQPTSIARRLNSLRSFWKYLRDNSYVERDPFLRISFPKRQRKLPNYLSQRECAALLAATGQQRSAAQAFRDRAVLSVLVFTGLRRAELLDLRVSSVDLDRATLRVEEGKGGKSRVIPLNDQAIEAIEDWLELRPEVDHDYLFTSRTSVPLGVKGLMGALKRAVKRAGLQGKDITLHTLRHTFACLMLQGGCDLFSLSQLLGHTRLDTTAIYLHATVDGLRGAVDKHPLNDI